jgi:hypothetical protein
MNFGTNPKLFKYIQNRLEIEKIKPTSWAKTQPMADAQECAAQPAAAA